MKIPHVTCADDMCYITETRDELQCMMPISEAYANREHYTIHPTKSAVVVYNSLDSLPIILYGKEFPKRHNKCIPNADE